MGTATRPAKTFAGLWDAFADVDVFVDEVMAELAAVAKEGGRPIRSGPKPALAGATLRKAVMGRWCTLPVQGEMIPIPRGYAMTGWRRTESGRPAANIRFSTATPMAASVCWAAKPRPRNRGPIRVL